MKKKHFQLEAEEKYLNLNGDYYIKGNVMGIELNNKGTVNATLRKYSFNITKTIFFNFFFSNEIVFKVTLK